MKNEQMIEGLKLDQIQHNQQLDQSENQTPPSSQQICKFQSLCGFLDNFIYPLSVQFQVMADLDSSLHSLNNSTSKQKFSFPKTERFRKVPKPICENIYQIPNTRSSRVTSFGYGQKDIGIRTDKCIPPIGTYQLGTEFKKDQHKGFSFGSGRDVSYSLLKEMELGGPLKDAKLLGYVPGPGQYNSNVSTLEPRSISLKAKLPDNSQRHLLKNPGPGTYGYEEMGNAVYYASSKFRNFTNHKISPGSRLSQIGRRSTIQVGPASYETAVQSLNGKGRYTLSNHQSSKTRIFDRSPRQSIVEKHMVGNPGPGQYATFSSFG